jgi:uncharacterized membrane protein YeaQ/YmgE (transglycosylase-associated protein family)
MGWLAWIVLGGVAGWLAGMVMHSRLGLVGDIVVGILGALLGGFLAPMLGLPGVTGFDFWTLFVALVGAVLLLFIVGLVFNRRARA